MRAEDIDALLPQTQCGECGYPGCLPYAEALLARSASINLCPPGGVTTLKKLGTLLEVDATPYLAEMTDKTRLPSIAVIDEAECVGCTKCIEACPVDAIIGSAKLMHTVLSELCTGCGLCVAPCPVDCIEMQPLEEAHFDPNAARERFKAKHTRKLRQAQDKEAAYRAKRELLQLSDERQDERMLKKAYIAEALKRVQAKRDK